MESEMLSLEYAKRIHSAFFYENIDFIHRLGLTSIHEYGFWLHNLKKESYLKIVDEKKWFLAKIKYGI